MAIMLSLSGRGRDNDMHHVKPEYIRKLESIKKEGTISISDFEKKFCASL